MDILEMLANEHGLIRRFLDHLSLAVQRLEVGRRPPREFFDKAVDFAHNFADRYHHFKEEYLMFVRLAHKKNGEIDGQLEALRYQHERGRSLVEAIAGQLDAYEAGEPVATAVLLESLATYNSLLRYHIHTEDHVLYPMARNAFSANELADLLEEFEKDRVRAGERTFETSHKLVVDMSSALAHME